jgi:diguanylate cyclase (GGDEF)-like protein
VSSPHPITSFADAVDLAVQTLERELESAAVWVGHLDSDRAVLRIVAAGGEASFGLEAGMEAPLETSFCQVMATGGGSQLSRDVASDADYANLPATFAMDVGAFVGAPMAFSDGTPVGTLCAFHHEAGAFSERDLALIGTFAAFLSRELEHARHRADLENVAEELRHQASTDALTGLANRRAFRAELDRAWRRSRRAGGRNAVALLDLDAFKAINDRYGHAAGDRVLVGVAEAMREACGPRDVVARLGGDEFGVVLRGDPVAWCAAVRASLAKPADGFPIGASIGYVDLAGTHSPEDALTTADTLLYADKRGHFDAVAG